MQSTYNKGNQVETKIKYQNEMPFVFNAVYLSVKIATWHLHKDPHGYKKKKLRKVRIAEIFNVTQGGALFFRNVRP